MHFMIDLETFGLGQDAPVFAVGCISLDSADDMNAGYYQTVRPEGHPDFDTIGYWLKQAMDNPDAAAQAVRAITHGKDYDAALHDLVAYIRTAWAMAYDGIGISPSERQPITVWSKGSIFDIAILRKAMEHRGIEVPWHFRNERCFRTVEAVFGNGVDNPPNGTLHHALADARWQAQKLNNIFAVHGDNLHFKA